MIGMARVASAHKNVGYKNCMVRIDLPINVGVGWKVVWGGFPARFCCGLTTPDPWKGSTFYVNHKCYIFENRT